MIPRRFTLILLASTLLATLPGCLYSNPQTPTKGTVTRLVTVPAGAKVYIPRLGRGGMVTPMDMTRDVRTTDKIQVLKEGYVTWEGQLKDLWQETEGCYKLTLRPRER